MSFWDWISLIGIIAFVGTALVMAFPYSLVLLVAFGWWYMR